MDCRRINTPSFLLALALCCASPALLQAAVDLREYRADSGIRVVVQDSNHLQVSWPASSTEEGEMIFDSRPDKPLIQSFGISRAGGPVKVIAAQLDPVTTLTIGERDKEKAAQAFHEMVFFENPRERPYETHAVTLTKTNVRVVSNGSRTTLILGTVLAGSFSGNLQFTFYRNSPLVHADTVMSTHETLRAILYDTGLSSAAPDWNNMVWLDPLGKLNKLTVNSNTPPTPLAVSHRAIVAEGASGSLAVFPAPHQYFYPLDFVNNFKITWYGKGYGKMPGGFGFGIRQPPEGDKRWVPWIDSPADTEQHLGVFYLLCPGKGEEALKEVARYTHGDRFKELPGYKTFTSHYHIEHTLDFLNRQKEQNTTGVPAGLETPGFVTKFKNTGVNIVHLAEFHQGWTPGQKTNERLKMLKTLHEECQRLSDDQFLLLPGEEPNVHLGGHWISLFPKPVYWVLNRAADEPFAEEIEGFGPVYHVGSGKDVLTLMEKEQGLMWTAHARIKASSAFPDGYREKEFYQSDHFLGAAWKAMPANLSRPTLGWRVLDLFDEMNQWGPKKQVLGEVDAFQVQPDYELYGHMNVNYLRLDKLPRFGDGWETILKTLRGGQFFVTTGEILIPQFSVGGSESGDTLKKAGVEQAVMEAHLEWTFPLAFAEIISGDGKLIHRQQIDLSDTGPFGTRTLRIPVNLSGQKWVRFEVWDIAANGAFTQPVWIE